MRDELIHLKNVETNNLKKLDVGIPLDRLTVVTGVSGSGKSSLVFDTLYSEAYRRYAESLSSFARQYLKALPKPPLDGVENLPAAIAVRQARSGASNRSTVGTMTELLDVVRILFAYLSEIYCCGHLIRKETGESIAQHTYQVAQRKKVMVLASLAEWKHLKAKELKEQLMAQGFTRAYCEEKVCKIEESTAKALRSGYVIIDRLQTTDDNYRRFVDAAELALKLGRGRATVLDDQDAFHHFDASLSCPSCSRSYVEPSLSLFNFNHPLGACSSCQGFGRVAQLDPEKIIPDREASLRSRGVLAWNFGQHERYYQLAEKSAKKFGIKPTQSFSRYSSAQWNWLLHGDPDGHFSGIEGYFRWLDSKKYKAHYRIHAARFRSYVQCPECEGKRLNRQALSCLIDGCNIDDIGNWTIKDLLQWFESLTSRRQQVEGRRNLALGVQEAIEEGCHRLGYLQKIGLPYLSLNRSSKTLSGGETQRINMARSLGNSLTATLFCLDEPSAGLHPRDSKNLLDVMRELRNQGNTVVVVEHERQIIDGAEHLIEIGPKAGHEGGYITYEGPPRQKAAADPEPELFEWSSWGPMPSTRFLKLRGAQTHNLQGIDVRVPTATLTVVCGVSGSGKTSLVKHTLFPMLRQALGLDKADDADETQTRAQSVGPKSVLKDLEDVVLVSQEGVGRSTRSNIASYLGIYDSVRKLLASTPLAQGRKLKPGYFSFNVPGGRCEVCKGLGTVEEDLSFLGEMQVTCPECQGKRFQEAALEVRYNNSTILDILKMTIIEARGFFHDQRDLRKTFDTVISMGLGYLTLGQHTSSFSGGEAQRLKITKFLLSKQKTGQRLFIFDEPTTGLSDQDVQHLLEQLRFLTRAGHTVVVVEHHLGVIQAADWAIEIGPDAADAGGQLVFEGLPRDLRNAATATSEFLRTRPNRAGRPRQRSVAKTKGQDYL